MLPVVDVGSKGAGASQWRREKREKVEERVRKITLCRADILISWAVNIEGGFSKLSVHGGGGCKMCGLARAR